MRIRVRGAVQGVGFRPFVHGLATRYGLSGFVLNDRDGVLAEIEGLGLEAFLTALRRERPPMAFIDALETERMPGQGGTGFTIRDSIGAGAAGTRVVPDAATCCDCLDDLFDPASRFHLYPFVTCTQCGPRLTITRRLPYDRANTSMSGFVVCHDCAADYADPSNRRFHAEAIACASCGPRLSHPIAAIAAALAEGQIVAIKGIGGFQLFCDATNEVAVKALRVVKQRPAKPFAVMIANEASVDRIGLVTALDRDLLRRTARPIVLLRSRNEPVPDGLAPSVAPGLDRVGVMLPSMPVHHLLFHALAGRPEGTAWHDRPQPTVLVVTSANLHGEPLMIDNADALQGLASIAYMIVTHDRPILCRADDSVMAVIDGAPAIMRRSRGIVPELINLGEDGPSVLATGAHLKATLCVTRGREAFLSQHIGDLDTAGTVRFYQETARTMLSMLDVVPELVACDMHPDYRSSIFAVETGLPVLRVQHHAAHLAAVAAEHHLRGPLIGVALDGTGLGDSGNGAGGNAWGGELMLLDGAAHRRIGHLHPLPLPSGDRAAREPWRMGVAALVALDRGAEASRRFSRIALAGPLAALLAAEAGPTTSSMGRLFDAAAALLGLRPYQGYEGHAAMEFEALVHSLRCLPGGYRIIDRVLDFRPLLSSLLEPRLQPREGAELFHGTLITGLVDWIARAATELGRTDIVLGGGCMTNCIVAEGLAAGLRSRGLVAWLPRAVPANDGGLSLGQAAIARAYLMNGGTSFQSSKG
ncbi:carbamoyltransferase HypF (plasmid) [Lichenicola cladoniae]|uniref:Carbamoyltransferase HypF n=2 Tax=Lichenicola cladoniae TaxID=1484109 RepID=A0A6M8HYX7_9PROT|nr:carbamoyltransferase HypF [Lichenicola cladoniae]NPD68189.1 carbamoyltransferase HypF [Acetobacteraceae bacterium]QKE93602.1 carbamoyltransferase HypF [Lichenicola cladoniae]